MKTRIHKKIIEISNPFKRLIPEYLPRKLKAMEVPTQEEFNRFSQWTVSMYIRKVVTVKEQNNKFKKVKIYYKNYITENNTEQEAINLMYTLKDYLLNNTNDRVIIGTIPEIHELVKEKKHDGFVANPGVVFEVSNPQKLDYEDLTQIINKRE